MRKAVELAIENVRNRRGGPFGALVVRKGELIASGVNLVTASNDPTAHAEMIAIRTACQILGTFRLFDCELYASCEPCPMCLGAIYWAHPDRVYYGCTRDIAATAGFDDAFIYKEISLPPDQRRIPALALITEQGKEPFEEWLRTPDKIPY
jgi:guanine deaminase